MKIQLTEDDVLRGTAVFPAETRTGGTVQVHCKALSWAASLQVSAAGNSGDVLMFTLLSGVTKDQATDEFLNQLTPESLVRAADVVMQLTNGLPGLKKAQAARNQNAQPATPISTPPPENCAEKDLNAVSAKDSAPRS